MYTYSACLEINPPSAGLELTHAQVWRGLTMKAENAVPFVPGMESCVVLERYADGFLREIVLRGERMRERITFTEPIQVRFERVEDPGWITNLVSESDFGLLLSFTFAVTFRGIAPGSEDERRRGQSMQASYLLAMQTTLDTVRRLAAEGKL